MTEPDQHLSLTKLLRPTLVAAALIFVSTFVSFFPYRNQNTYLLHASGTDNLNADWLKATVDPFPIATALSRFFMVFGQPGLAAAYFSCAFAFAFASAMIARASNDLRSLPSVLLGCAIALPWILAPLIGSDLHGPAEQYILGGAWQPSEAGSAGLVLAIGLYVAGWPVAAALAIAAGIWLHPGSALGGVLVMVAIFLGLTVRGYIGVALKSGLICFAFCLPIILFTRALLGGDPSGVVLRAQHILVHERIPHHALPTAWLGVETALQISVVLLGILVLRRNARLVFLLTTISALSLILTGIAAGIQSDGLFLLFPWRIFAVLIPLVSSLICVRLLVPVDRTGVTRPAVVFAAATLGALLAHAKTQIAVGMQFIDQGPYGRTLSAATRMIGPSQPFYVTRDLAELLRWARNYGPRGVIYLVPPELETFRLGTGHPIYADWKSHPFKASELVAWYDRVYAAAAFYRAPGCSVDPFRAPHFGEVAVVIFPSTSACREFGKVVFQNEEFTAIVGR